VECTKNHNVEKCNQCKNFPCEKIKSMLARSEEYKISCQKLCSSEEYQILEKAFFEKEKNLGK
jgi:hypothetical protein